MKRILLIMMLALMSFLLLAQDSFEDFAKQDQQGFQNFYEKEAKEMANFHSQQDSLFIQFQKDIENMWKTYKESTPKTWVSYTKGFEGRSEVDFEKGKVQVEAVVDPKEDKSKEKAKAIVKEQLKSILQEKDDTGKPILEGQVQSPDNKEQAIDDKNLDKIAEEVVNNAKTEEVKGADGKMRTVYKIDLELMPNQVQKRARHYLPTVFKSCEKFGVDAPLALAIIETESSFNPKAYNRTGNAYGLMQIVPKYAGQTMNKELHKTNKPPTSDQLFDPDFNAEMGIGYLSWIAKNKWGDVKNKRNLYYAVTCSYNGGWGTIYKAMTGVMNKIGQKRWDKMMKDLNEMDSEELFKKLR
ncbi:MAG: DUF3393 domain-containing protein, partial [Candidatus Cloacimonetes bacterium]|nr:DUF3393 domain-containing protein [Candidatus Cloacimonadota bacterium]